MEGAEAGILDGFIRNVFMLRDQAVADTISLREGDLEVLATATGRRVREFLEAIEPALPPNTPRTPERSFGSGNKGDVRFPGQPSASGTRRSGGINSSMSP